MTYSRDYIKLVCTSYLGMSLLLQLSLDWEEQCSNSSVLSVSGRCCFLDVLGLGHRFRGEDVTVSSFLSGEVSSSKDPFNLHRVERSNSEDGNLRITQPESESQGSCCICVFKLRRSSRKKITRKVGQLCGKS